MNSKNTLCLIIDIQTKLVPAMHENHRFVNDCVKLLSGLSKLSIPCMLSEQYPKGLGKTVSLVKSFTANATLVEKTQFSAFLPEIEAFIQQHQAKNIIVIGAETHICVLQTVLDLCKKNLNVYLPIECVTSRTLENKQNGLMQMQQAGAIISNIESILFMLLKDAKHPAFKTISTLIQ
ncbi:isochorismatase family protein [Mannheimia sp. E30BD]|uniref:isochorismatase family protein n=1 Tax=Mannheimia sp. E30BD TaxID=3278708 RepID=UPI00359D8474